MIPAVTTTNRNSPAQVVHYYYYYYYYYLGEKARERKCQKPAIQETTEEEDNL